METMKMCMMIKKDFLDDSIEFDENGDANSNIFALFASYRSKIWQTRIGGNRSSISHKGNISRLHLMRKEP
ncbi:hypothetical protein RCL_jg19778.t1 [Rhizophagus clarus]|uniref:Uncharacterized protein n=1 Tax=Rhizophagus clarus TaxID=94130 RepID=A0A8H3M575_9GLOM|nr:hypothetical protein RCL_jg19778.t1 [Rhizophagus clarus]